MIKPFDPVDCTCPAKRGIDVQCPVLGHPYHFRARGERNALIQAWAQARAVSDDDLGAKCPLHNLGYLAGLYTDMAGDEVKQRHGPDDRDSDDDSCVNGLQQTTYGVKDQGSTETEIESTMTNIWRAGVLSGQIGPCPPAPRGQGLPPYYTDGLRGIIDFGHVIDQHTGPEKHCAGSVCCHASYINNGGELICWSNCDPTIDPDDFDKLYWAASLPGLTYDETAGGAPWYSRDYCTRCDLMVPVEPESPEIDECKCNMPPEVRNGPITACLKYVSRYWAAMARFVAR